MTNKQIKARLNFLRDMIETENISTGEIVELQSLAKYIDKSDSLLLEWAGVPEENKNTCDKCGEVDLSENLIWITAEGFTPLGDEKLPKEAFKKYDALCDNCYEGLLI